MLFMKKVTGTIGRIILPDGVQLQVGQFDKHEQYQPEPDLLPQIGEIFDNRLQNH